jgi:hypothetical protein
MNQMQHSKRLGYAFQNTSERMPAMLWQFAHINSIQSKVLRLIVDAPWNVSNSVIRNDLQIRTVKEEISRFSSHYNVRISVHPMKSSPHSPSRLRRYWPHDLLVRF